LLLTVPVIAAQARAAQQSGGAAASTPTPPANTGLTAIESDLQAVWFHAKKRSTGAQLEYPASGSRACSHRRYGE